MRVDLIKKIDKLLTENSGRIPEERVCQIFNIASHQIPWGYDVTWARAFQSNQTYDLVQNSQESKRKSSAWGKPTIGME